MNVKQTWPRNLLPLNKTLPKKKIFFCEQNMAWLYKVISLKLKHYPYDFYLH